MTERIDTSLPNRRPAGFIYGWGAILLWAAVFVIAMLPQLHRLEFFDGVEHFNLATVQEMKRDGGNWLLPTLDGEPRVVKPPLTAWLTAMFVSHDTVAAIHTPDPVRRQAAIDRFVFLSRLPTILCAAMLLLGVYRWGTAVADRRTALVAGVICAGLLLFIYQGRRSTTDLQLAVWVTWTNALLAAAIIERRVARNLLLAGVTLGLAMLAKGPHIALLLTVCPAVAYLVLKRFEGRPASAGRSEAVSVTPLKRSTLVVLLLASLAIAFTIGLIWYAYVLYQVPGVMQQWLNEMFRKNMQVGRNTMHPDPWYAYNTIFGQLMPWTPWVLWGGWIAFRDRLDRRLMLPLISLLLPLGVMCFFGEKKVRYLLPFVGPAAMLAAAAFTGWGRTRHTDSTIAAQPLAALRTPCRSIAELVTLLSTLWIAIGIPAIGAMGLKGYRTWDDHPWFSPAYAIAISLAAIIILIAGFALSKRSPLAWAIAIVLMTWLGAEARLRGESLSPGDADDRPQRQLADQIWQTYPTARILSADSPTLYGQLNRGAIVLAMYADRLVYTAPPALPTQPTGQPLVLITDSIDTVPPVPAGWRRWMDLPLRVGRRYVDVLE